MSLSKYKYPIGTSSTLYMTPAFLKDYFRMGDPEKGESSDTVYWAKDRQKMKAGKLAGCLVGKCLTVGLHGKILLVSEVAFTIQTGNFPTGKVIHLDGNVVNNSIGNLHVQP